MHRTDSRFPYGLSATPFMRTAPNLDGTPLKLVSKVDLDILEGIKGLDLVKVERHSR
jgi:hypothetical protein